MNCEGKKVNHFAYGTGTVTAFYNRSKTIWVKFGNSVPKCYNLLEDLERGYLSTNDDEIINYINHLPRNIFNKNKINHKQTPNKNLVKFAEECSEILDDLNISIDAVDEIKVAQKPLKVLGSCNPNFDEAGKIKSYTIEIDPVLLSDEAYDIDLYNVLLHMLMLASTDPEKNKKRGHCKTWKDNANLINKELGYSIQTNINSETIPNCFALK